MRCLLVIILITTIAGSAQAFDLGSASKDIKNSNHVGMNPGTPDGRQGGETMADAFVIEAIPFYDTGQYLRQQ